ncbi:Nn.00g019210.m01.CDS01 [Neocucurbitaria sp. VM-36]
MGRVWTFVSTGHSVTGECAFQLSSKARANLRLPPDSGDGDEARLLALQASNAIGANPSATNVLQPNLNAIQHLNQRLEFLEQQISRNGDRGSPSTSVPSSQDAVREITPVPSPEASLTVGDGQESWVYRLATDTRRNFQNQTTPVSTPTPRIDNAMLSLNEALDDLGNLRVRADMFDADFSLSPKEAKECIDAFVSLMSTMVVPDIFTASLDIKLFYALPDIVDSPYINIDPGVRVMYYNALYYGLQQTRGPGGPLVQSAYMKVLEAVPAWLEASTETAMDGHTAALTAWTAINNQDYQLSWKFHCKSCHFMKLKGIDQLDVIPAKTFEEESGRDALRFLYWHILSTDTLFRTFYGKPTVVRWSPKKVRPPALFHVSNMHPSAHQVTVTVVWVRYTLMTAEMINFIDNNSSHDRNEIVAQRVDEFCLQLEALMVEFNLEPLMHANDTTNSFRCLLADHIMNIYAIIIGIKRLVKRTVQGRHVDAVAVRAARKVVSIILGFNSHTDLPGETKSIFDHFITFYPFCAVFSLYEYVLACTNPDDCEDDIRSLENIGTAMAQACAVRQDFLPFAKTVNALNKVSRSLQDERRKDQSIDGINEMSEATQLPPHGVHLPTATFDNFQDLVASELPQFDATSFPSLPDFPMTLDGDFHPLGFVRALENDFQNRNWHDNWWDLSGGAGEGMTGTSEG